MGNNATTPLLLKSGGTATILMVEDQPLVRAFISEALRQFGHTVVEATNADEAVAVLRSQAIFDFVITDLQMPGSIDGAGLARIIRTEFPFLKTIMISGGRRPDAATLALVDRYLSKPVDPSDLDDCLRAWVGLSRQQCAA